MSGRSHPCTFLLGTSITFSAAQSPFYRGHRRERSVTAAQGGSQEGSAGQSGEKQSVLFI